MRFQQVRAPFSSNASNARVSHSVRRLRGSLQVGCRLMCRRGDAGLTRAWLAQVDLSRRACRHRTLCPNHAQSSSASNRRGTLAAVPGRQRILSCHLQTLRKEMAPPSPRPQDQNLGVCGHSQKCQSPELKVPAARQRRDVPAGGRSAWTLLLLACGQKPAIFSHRPKPCPNGQVEKELAESFKRDFYRRSPSLPEYAQVASMGPGRGTRACIQRRK